MFTKSKVALLSIAFILFPLFFLPITQEFYAINKFVLVFLVSFTLIVVALIQLLIERKITISYSKMDTSVLLMIIAMGASILIPTPNKMSALFNFPLGMASLLTFAILYIFTKNISDHSWKTFKPLTLLAIGGIISSFIALVFFVNPFATYPLPSMMNFLKTPLFNTVGSTLDLLLYSGFFVCLAIGAVVHKSKENITRYVAGGIATIVIVITLFTVVKANQLRLPPLSQSWLAAIETLKAPKTALFGVGIDNFAGQFTLVKNEAYNTSQLWNTNFALSRSGLLQIWTEMGVVGLASVIAILITALLLMRELLAKKDSQIVTFALTGTYLGVMFVLFPISYPLLFLLFIYLGLLAARADQKHVSIDLHKNLPLYLVTLFTFAILLPTSVYGVFKTYISEVHFKSALDTLSTGQVVPIYQNLQNAIILNPYQEKYRLTFSQLNLLVANNIALQKKDKLTDQDRQTITQAIQDAIREAKAAVALNPDKSSNWENLAIIYQNLLNVAQGADAWAVSAYQKAILQDPVNPQLRLALGGVYYSLKQYPNAATFFSQAVSLKPDWPNARYNLAWALFQNKDYDKAILVMQNVLTLIEKGSPDYAKAAADLKVFQDAKTNQAQQSAVIPATEQKEATQAATLPNEKIATTEAQLDLPQQPKAVVSPKIALPTEQPQPTP